MRDDGRAFVFDLDGVIRHWEPGIVRKIERNQGLPEGGLLRVAFEPSLLNRAITGDLSDADWRDEILRRLQVQFPDVDGRRVVELWSEPCGEVIDGSMEVLAQARERGQICLLSNATSRLQNDLDALGLTSAFDHLFNSSEIGSAKLEARIYQHVEDVLDLPGGQIVYVDDSLPNIHAAAERGWTALHMYAGTTLSELLAPYLS